MFLRDPTVCSGSCESFSSENLAGETLGRASPLIARCPFLSLSPYLQYNQPASHSCCYRDKPVSPGNKSTWTFSPAAASQGSGHHSNVTSGGYKGQLSRFTSKEMVSSCTLYYLNVLSLKKHIGYSGITTFNTYTFT